MGPTCSIAKCNFEISGLCLEELGDSCHNILPPKDVVNDLSPKSNEVFFHSGEKLTADETSRLLNAIPARIVLCAGTQAAGKTTFLARLVELFRMGSVASHCFAKSLTLVGFERATWHATINSSGARPDTRRTSRAENDHFLHLRVQASDASSLATDLLISDLSGESYRDAVGSKVFCKEQLAMVRADIVCLFIDSSTLIDKRKRFSEQDNAVNFLHRVREVVHAGRSPTVNIIFSRWDQLFDSDNSEEHRKFCDEIQSSITNTFQHRFKSLTFHRVAARPSTGKPTDDEVKRVFESWVAPHFFGSIPSIKRCQHPARDFSAYGLP